MVKLNAFRTQWHKNMKRKVVVDVIYVQFDMGRIIRSPGSDISLFLLLRFIAILIRFIELLYRFIELL